MGQEDVTDVLKTTEDQVERKMVSIIWSQSPRQDTDCKSADEEDQGIRAMQGDKNQVGSTLDEHVKRIQQCSQEDGTVVKHWSQPNYIHIKYESLSLVVVSL